MKKTLTCLSRKSFFRRNGTVFLFHVFWALCLFQSQKVIAADAVQNETVTVSVQKAGVDKVIELIARQSNLNFVYSIDDVRKLPPVTINLKNVPVKEVLDLCLANSNLVYQVSPDRVIIISEKKDSGEKSLSKTITVRGQIIDDSGKPLPGATVLIKGTTKGVIADSNGEFRMQVPDTATLVISFIGFKVKEIPVAGQDRLVIRMVADIKKLGDIQVISTGYQKIDQTATTGSFGYISSREIESSPNVNIMERLDGKVAGVRFDVDDNKIEIRGTNTYNESRTPLIVIDGFPALKQSLADYPDTELSGTTSDSNNAILSAVNPNDIESITFLKDAAAASIWGSQAANGVIVIETKKGRNRGNDLPVVSLSSQLSISSPADLNKLDVMDSRQYIDLEKEIFDLGYTYDPYSYWRYQNESDAVNLMFAQQRGEITSDEMDAGLETLAQRDNKGQIRDYLLQRAVTQQYNLSVSGSSDKVGYYVSGSFSDNRPVFRSNSSNQYSVTANITAKLFNDRITLTTGINEMISKSKVNGAALAAMTPGSYGLRPYDLLVDENGQSIDRYLKFTPDVIDGFTEKGYLPWTYNSLDELNYGNTLYNKDASRINARLSGKVTDWLEASVSGSYQRLNTEWRKLNEVESYETRDLINEGTTINTNGKLVYGVPVGGVYKTSNTFSNDYSVRGQIDIKKNWNRFHKLSVIAGSEIREAKAHGYNQTRYGYDPLTSSSAAFNPTTPYNNIYGYTSMLGYSDGSIFQSRRRYLSYYSNANYSFMERYFLSGSMRFDDTNMLGVDRRNRAQPLWSAGFKWNLLSEEFMKQIAALGRLDVRLSYGTGGTAPGGGSNVSTIAIGGTDSYTGLPYGTIYPGNRDLGWEKTKTFNVGLDISLFNSRLSSIIDVYAKRSSGILVSLPINGTYGQTSLMYNTGTLSGHGYELSLEGIPVRSANWTWSLGFNLSYNTNKVTDNRFPNTLTSPTGTTVIEGYPVDYLFTYRWAGLDNQGQSQIYDAEGDIITADMSSVDFKPEDFKYAGRKTPPYFGSVSTTLRYKQLSLYMQANYSLGNKLLVDNINISQYPYNKYSSGFLSNSKAMVNRWRKPGDEASTNVPGLEYTSFTSIQRYQYADINVISGSFMRMQQVSLNYLMPSSFIRRLKVVQSVSVGATVENLGLIWTKNKEHRDPEHIFSGTYTSLPPSKNYSFSLNVSF